MKLELDMDVLKQPKPDEEATRKEQLRKDMEEQIGIYNKIIQKNWRGNSTQVLYDQIYPELPSPELEDENSLSLYDRSKYSIEKRSVEIEKIRERNKERQKQFEEQKAKYYHPDIVLFKICLMRVAFEHHEDVNKGPYLWNEDFSNEEVLEVKKIRRLLYSAQKAEVGIMAVSDILKILWPNLTKHDLLRKELLIFKVVFRCFHEHYVEERCNYSLGAPWWYNKYFNYQPKITDYEWSEDKAETYLWVAENLTDQFGHFLRDWEIKQFESEIGWGEPEPRAPNWQREPEEE